MERDVVCKCCGTTQKIWNVIDNWYLIDGKEYCPPCYRKIKKK